MSAGQEGWPVAIERDVLAASLVHGRLENMEIVIWRSDDDMIRVWEDRCPHRSVRFSAGRNFGDCIEDFYHGWRFDKKGALVSMPVGSDLPVLRARVLRTAVGSGLVWATAGDPAPKDGIEKSEGEVLVRPLPVNLPSSKVAAVLPALAGLRLVATPTGATSCTIYGVAAREDGEAPLATQWRANLTLTALRRKLEAGRTP